MAKEDTKKFYGRAPDMILKAVERPENPSERFGKSFRVGAAWLNEDNRNISIQLDNYVVLQGKPYQNTVLLLVPREEEQNGNS